MVLQTTAATAILPLAPGAEVRAAAQVVRVRQEAVAEEAHPSEDFNQGWR